MSKHGAVRGVGGLHRCHQLTKPDAQVSESHGGK